MCTSSFGSGYVKQFKFLNTMISYCIIRLKIKKKINFEEFYPYQVFTVIRFSNNNNKNNR